MAFPALLDTCVLFSPTLTDTLLRVAEEGAFSPARCEVVVTFNLKDFPIASTSPHQVTVVDPDAFLLDQLDLHPAKVGRALVGQMTAAKRPPLSMGQLLGRLAKSGVEDFADEARRHEFA